MIPFYHFHWSSKILVNLPNPIINLITVLLKITKNKFRPPNPAISLAITFFLHTYTTAYSASSIYLYTKMVEPYTNRVKSAPEISTLANLKFGGVGDFFFVPRTQATLSTLSPCAANAFREEVFLWVCELEWRGPHHDLLCEVFCIHGQTKGSLEAGSVVFDCGGVQSLELSNRVGPNFRLIIYIVTGLCTSFVVCNTLAAL